MHGLAKYLTGLAWPSAGQSEHHIKNCIIFIKKSHESSRDILVSLDMVSLFAKIPMEDTLLLLSSHFHKQTLAIITQVLTMISISPQKLFLGQRDGTATFLCNSQLLHWIFWIAGHKLGSQEANTWVQIYDWYICVWIHGKEELQGFLQYHGNTYRPLSILTSDLNNIH